MSNLARNLFASAVRNPDGVAAIDEAGSTWTYDQVALLTKEVAGGLRESGVREGDRVVYQLSNGPAATLLFYGALSVGAVAVPISPLLSASETETIRERVKPQLSIGEDGNGHHITIEGPSDVEGLPRAGIGHDLPIARDERDRAVIFFTSGTTGTPKGVVLSHGNLSSNARWVATEGMGAPWTSETCSAAVLPLSHSFALTCSQNAAILAGGTISYTARFCGESLLKQIRRDGVTVAALVPSAAGALLDASRADPGTVPLQYAMIGGAPIPPELVDDLERSLELSVLEGYGLSETSPVCAFRTPDIPRKSGSVGRAAGYAELAIASEDDGVLSVGEGELLVRGPGVFDGYLDRAEDPGDDVFVEGWLKTGDIVRLDPDGDVFVLDRKKDLIIRNGYNVSPVEIEQVLYRCPGVLDAGVVGVPDRKVGEEIAACVILESETVSESDILAFCQRELARYKCPRRIERVDAIPRGTKGQVLRDLLRVILT